MNYLVACQTNIWGEKSLNKVIPEVAALGVDGVEIPVEALFYGQCGWHELMVLMARYQLRVAAVYISAMLGYADGKIASAELHRTLSWLEVAKACNIQTLIIGDPPRRFISNIDVLAENLNSLGRAALDNGINLCYQPHHGGPIESPEEIRRLMSATDPDTVKLCWDTAHIAWGGGDPAGLIPEFAPRIHYVQLKDLRWKPLSRFEKLILGMRYLGLLSRERWKEAGLPVALHFLNKNTPFFVELGHGDVNFERVLKKLDETAYDGWITIEQDRPTLLPGISMRENIRALTKLLSKV